MSERRIIVGPCRSGTSMLYRSMKNRSDTVMDFQSIKKGQRENGVPNYQFFVRDVLQNAFLIGKETIGYGTTADCQLVVFPNAQEIAKTPALFLFREPRATFQSWLENNLATVEEGPHLFIRAYKHAMRLLLSAQENNPQTTAVLFEQLCEHPQQELERICQRWTMPFQKSMLQWKDTFLTDEELDEDGVQAGHYSGIAASSTIERRKKEIHLPESVESEIQGALQPLYEKVATQVHSNALKQ